MITGIPASEASARAALARARGSCRSAIAATEPFNLIVDLAHEPVGPRWLRGAATLALLCGSALAFAPGFNTFSPASAHGAAQGAEQFQHNEMLGPMLGGTEAQDGDETPPQVLADPAAVPEPVIVTNGSEVRIRGAVTEGLYWSLREVGVSPQVAADYLTALATRIDVGADIAPYDRFDLVISKKRGEALLYAALHRFEGPDVELMKWSLGGSADWFDTEASGAHRSAGLMTPVVGRITSGFGHRHHPIFRFTRFHAGIDIAAPMGSAVVAAADGQVVAAGWNGGYGRQLRVVHENGIVTSYSHMSGFAASPGEPVRQGQVIGFVGSTGISTGPHLHFEVLVNGRAVDPLQVRFETRKVIGGADRQAFNARLRQLKAIGSKGA
jgi:murein DD-endopeptidase MepM/ murein hydrolase activator NlpD